MTLCAWCGNAIDAKEKAWVSPRDPNSKVHDDCFNLIWKLAYTAHALAKVLEESERWTRGKTFWPHKEPKELDP